MPLDNFIVRPLRKYVEPFRQRSRWNALSPTDAADLDRFVSGLPSQQPEDDETAKRFDVLTLQLIKGAPSAKAQLGRVLEIAEKLEGKAAVPAVKEKLPLLHEVGQEGFWQGMSAERLESLRQSLHDLTQYINKAERWVIYSDFEDELGEAQEVVAPYLTGGVNVAQYRKKVEAFSKSTCATRYPQAHRP